MSLRASEKTDVRRNMYKSCVDADDQGRRRREDNMVEIRKKKREENLQKKRRQFVIEQQEQETDIQVKDMERMVSGVMSEDRDIQLEATTWFQRLLSTGGHNPPLIDEVIESGVVPRLVQFLSRDDFPDLQFKAAWALTNIASGTSQNTMVIVQSGAVPLFIKLLSSNSQDIRDQAVWGLGNVAGDSVNCRDFVLSLGVMMPLLAQFNELSGVKMLRNSAWTLSNLCRGKPQPALEQTIPALPILEKLLHSTDEEVLIDASWAFSYISEGGSYEGIQAVIDCGAVPRLVQLLSHPSVLTPAILTIRHIVTGNVLHTQLVLDHTPLPALLNILRNGYKSIIKKEAVLTISNITARTISQIQQVIEAGIMQHVITLAQYGEFAIKQKAVSAVSNAIRGGSHDQIKFLVDQGCIKPLCDVLTYSDPDIVFATLKALQNILKVGEFEKNYLYTQMIDDSGGWDKMELLLDEYYGANNHIYELANSIIESDESYWGKEYYDQHGDNVVPEEYY